MRTQLPARSRLDFALPTINIIFLLILYFLVAGSMFDHTEAGIRPPEATAAQARLARPLLTVNTLGEVQLDGRPMSVAVAAAAAIESGATTITILVAADFPAQSLASIIASLSHTGLDARLLTLRSAQ